jgi:RNA polymerase sigma factor (sigma-70 family)
MATEGIRPVDAAELFERHGSQVPAVVSRSVRTSPVNVEDACGFAWLQLVRRRPPAPVAFAWLCTTAIREAAKLHRRTAQMLDLDRVADALADPVRRIDDRLELIAAGEEVRAARLRPREARLLGLRLAGYSRDQIAQLTGDSHRTVDRQLGRAQRKLRTARRAEAKVG